MLEKTYQALISPSPELSVQTLRYCNSPRGRGTDIKKESQDPFLNMLLSGSLNNLNRKEFNTNINNVSTVTVHPYLL